jgi:GntR family transcriptional regulator
MKTLDSSSPIPLYYQLKAAIEERIESGQWKPGDRVPSESGLEELFQVSRTTVRQALGDLVSQGRLTRARGRGTFVAQPRIQQALTYLTGFTQDMRARGKQPGSRLLHFEVTQAPAVVARMLRIEPGEAVIRIKRLRLADEAPMAVETSFLVYRLCPGLLDEDLSTQSLYDLLGQKLNLVPSRAHQELAAVGCPKPEAALLGIPLGAPVLHIHRTTFSQSGDPFEQAESYYRGDRYVFVADLFAAGRQEMRVV